MGIALNPSDFNNWEEIKDTITANFNSFTCENEMKPDAVLRQKESQDGLADGSTYKDPVIDLSTKVSTRLCGMHRHRGGSLPRIIQMRESM